MKKIILLFALLLSLNGFAQQLNYPENRPELLLGKTVSVRPLYKSEKGYPDIYTDKDRMHGYELSLDTEYGQDVTKPEAMAGKTFKVIAYDPADSVFELKGKDDAKILYYKYGNLLNYRFIVQGGLDVPADFFDYYVESGTALDGRALFTTNKEIAAIKIIRFSADKDLGIGETYLLTYNLEGNNRKPGTGVSFTLENGKKIERPKLPLKVQDGRFEKYILAVITLTNAEIELLKNYRVVKARLITYDDAISDETGLRLKGALSRIMAKSF